jgi:hypothetical protein
MKKRVISLLILSVILATAPAAMANHCFKCKAISLACVLAPNGGYDSCGGADHDCILGEPCGIHREGTQPLASEYEVASVERADEPQPSPNETRVAALEPKLEPAPAPAAQR